jgi:hypothetical protein
MFSRRTRQTRSIRSWMTRRSGSPGRRGLRHGFPSWMSNAVRSGRIGNHHLQYGNRQPPVVKHHRHHCHLRARRLPSLIVPDEDAKYNSDVEVAAVSNPQKGNTYRRWTSGLPKISRIRDAYLRVSYESRCLVSFKRSSANVLARGIPDDQGHCFELRKVD